MDDPFMNDESCEDDDLSDLNLPLLFGRFLVHSGVIDEAALERALRVQAELNHQFGCAALEAGDISPDDWVACRRYQREHAVTFLEAASELGVLSEPDIGRINDLMAESHLHLGEVLLKQGALQRQQLEPLIQAFSRGRYF